MRDETTISNALSHSTYETGETVPSDCSLGGITPRARFTRRLVRHRDEYVRDKDHDKLGNTDKIPSASTRVKVRDATLRVM